MKGGEEANDRTPLILPRLVSRHISEENYGQRTNQIRGLNRRFMAPFLVVVALERFTYYSIIVNLFLFFSDDVYQNSQQKEIVKAGQDGDRPTNAIISVMILIGLSWFFCMLGGWISDGKLGKLKTIIWGLVIYTLGTGMLLMSAYFCINKNFLYRQKSLYRALVVFASILIAIIGEGAHKANIAAFGAEQLDRKNPDSTRRYFNFYYLSVNLGSMLAFSVSAYVQQAHGFVTGFAIPFSTITLALIIFVLSKDRYKTLPCQRTVGKVYQIIREARRNYKRSKKSDSPISIQQKIPWLEYAKIKFGGSFLDWEVDQVKFLFAIIPVFIVLLPYQTIDNQTNATFLQQGVRMKITIDNFKHFPVAWLTFFNSVIIVILLPFMEKVVYPWLTKRGYKMIPLTRISIGILVSCFAVIAAGFVEISVMDRFAHNDTVENPNINSRTFVAANLSVFYQLPQYVLIGVSEIFATVGGLEFAYSNAPQSMQAVVMALFFVTISFGSLLGSGLLEIFEASGLLKRKTKGGIYYDLTYYFFLLGGLTLLSWIVFISYIDHRRRKRARQPKIRSFGRMRNADSPDISSVTG
ncbi:solute carrier family 15 member 4-like [Dendronephthya gigantea]|uniref:solute carrier family 15 member 4-like n=1 Tax=Dendronephthya gigantea TaxID=151771 RepID=UPI0010693779|nr:solute carrier family 15 member 4-like [Dendronephthya gigantea]